MMILKHLTIAIRILRKYAVYSLSNILGLAAGISICIFTLLFLRHGFTIDEYHHDYERICRLTTAFTEGGLTTHYSGSSTEATENLQDFFPEIQHQARMYASGGYIFKIEDRSFVEQEIMWADASLFSLFNLPVLQGDPNKLKDPHSLVLTKSIAKKYFGEINPMNKLLSVNVGGEGYIDFTVGAVIEDLPRTTHMKFDILLPFAYIDGIDKNISDEVLDLLRITATSWEGGHTQVYLKLDDESALTTLSDRLPDYLEKFRPPFKRGMEIIPQPISEIYFSKSLRHDPARHGDVQQLYLLTAIGFLILLVSCINHINSATAHATLRSKEIGMRKVLGSDKRQLRIQFMFESGLVVLISVILAVLISIITVPLGRELSGIPIQVTDIFNLRILFYITVLLMSVSFLAGFYPAYLLSGIKLMPAIRGGNIGGTDQKIRNILVCIQLVVSGILVVSILAIRLQLDFLNSKSLGFNEENVLLVTIWDAKTAENYEDYQQSFLRVPGVLDVSTGTCYPGDRYFRGTFQPEGRKGEDHIKININPIDYNYFGSLGIELVDGRIFSQEHPADQRSNFIINEAAARALEWKDPVGKSIAWRRISPDDGTSYYDFWGGSVVGVVEDYNFRSLHSDIEPIVFLLYKEWYSQFAIRIADAEQNQTIDKLRQVWNTFGDTMPFQYEYLESRIDSNYAADQQFARLISIFTIIGIILTCSGLFGLAAFISQLKLREFGIRKVLGGSVVDLTKIFVSRFLVLILISQVAVIPLAYYLVDMWLADFAYRISLSWSYFLFAVIFVATIVLLTVLYQTLKLVRVNMVDVLKAE